MIFHRVLLCLLPIAKAVNILRFVDVKSSWLLPINANDPLLALMAPEDGPRHSIPFAELKEYE